MSSALSLFDGANVTVVGDIMLDRYWNGTTSRISPEAPVPVVKVEGTTERVGGSGNVAANITGLGASAGLMAMIGHDDAGAQLQDLCAHLGIDARLFQSKGHSTPVKLRVLSQHQQLIRLDFETNEVSADQRVSMLNAFRERLSLSNAVVLSDYGKGTIDDPASFIEPAKAAGIPVIVDPKGRDFSRYRGASLVTPNVVEFEAVVGACADENDLERKARTLLDDCGIDALLVTRGEKGVALIERSNPMRLLPTHAQEVFDVTGAGDTVCAVAAVALGAGMPLDKAVECANAAAGVVVSKLGTATVSRDELASVLGGTAHRAAQTADLEELVETVVASQQRGERIVMTNGCFDILHAGHVAYLDAARRLGDRLLVAVNSDRSVAALKGPGRPLNSLQHRMAVLGALKSVDWVTSFDETTPLTLVEKIGPDVLVKGGDYREQDIVGAEHVKRRGGRVHVLPYIDGFSTTNLLAKMGNEQQGSDR